MMRRFQTEPDESFKNQILYAFSQMNNPRAMEKLFEAARQSDNPRVRREARFLIQQTINGRLARELPKGAGGGKEEEQFDDQAERIMKEQSPEKAVTTFTQIAKTNPNLRIRLRAIFYLIKLDDPRVLDFYSELLSH
jgi:HEAT repeat protein